MRMNKGVSGYGWATNTGVMVSIDEGRLKYLTECWEILTTEHRQRAQAIHENNKIRKQNEELRKRNAELEKRTALAETYNREIRAMASNIKHAALSTLHSGWLERAYNAGGIANVREALKVAMGFDGLSQTDIDLGA